MLGQIMAGSSTSLLAPPCAGTQGMRLTAVEGGRRPLTESMDAELKDRGVNVNCVMPAIIDTPQNRAAMPDADFGSRWVAPEAVADVISYFWLLRWRSRSRLQARLKEDKGTGEGRQGEERGR